MTTTTRPLNSEAAAAMIGISPTTLRIWRCTGKGPTFTKLGEAKQAGVVYFASDIQAWLDERKFTSTSAYSPHGRASSKPHNRSPVGASG
jgi:predicted DNA-binding transcriptional regulator AlpA